MRNLKRVLSLVMAVAMLIGLMVVSAGAASTYEDFTDKDEIVNTEAVNTLVSLGVLNGKEDGSYFDPTGTVTRAEMAKIIAVCLNGGSDPLLGTGAVTTQFSDVASNYWAAPYIAYCANLGIINGKGDGTFGPEEPVTGTAAAKMFLCALGYRADIEGLTGSGWDLNTDTLANKVGLYDGMTIVPSNGLSRDNTAQLVYNGIQANEVEYKNNYGEYSGVIYAQPIGTILENRFHVVKVEGVVVANEIFAIDGGAKTVAGKSRFVDCNTWTDSKGNEYGYDGIYPITIDNDMVGRRVVIYVQFQNNLSPNAVNSKVVGEPILSNKNTEVSTAGKLATADKVKSFLNDNNLIVGAANAAARGVLNVTGTASTSVLNNGDTVAPTLNHGINEKAGRQVTFIDNNGDNIVDYIITEVADMAKVSVYDETNEKMTIAGVGSVDFKNIADPSAVALNDIVLHVKYGDTYYVTKAETVSGKFEAYNASTEKLRMDGTEYGVSAVGLSTAGAPTLERYTADADLVGDTYTLYLDFYGNAVAQELGEESLGNYAVVLSSADTTSGITPKGEVKLLKADGTTSIYEVNLLASANKFGGLGATTNAAREANMADLLGGSAEAGYAAGAIKYMIVTYVVGEDGKVVLSDPNLFNSYDSVILGTASSTPQVKRSQTTYEITGTAWDNVTGTTVDAGESRTVLANDSTVFFFVDRTQATESLKAEPKVVVGLSNLTIGAVQTSGGADSAAFGAVWDSRTTGNVAKAIVVDAEYVGTANYLYVVDDEVQTKNENGETIYTYDVVFDSGEAGQIQVRGGTDDLTNPVKAGYIYSYVADGKYTTLHSYQTTAGFGVNNTVNGYVTTYANANTIELAWGQNKAQLSKSLNLANDIKVINVEDGKNPYSTSLSDCNSVALATNSDGLVKVAFVKATNVEFRAVTNATGTIANVENMATVNGTTGLPGAAAAMNNGVSIQVASGFSFKATGVTPSTTNAMTYVSTSDDGSDVKTEHVKSSSTGAVSFTMPAYATVKITDVIGVVSPTALSVSATTPALTTQGGTAATAAATNADGAVTYTWYESNAGFSVKNALSANFSASGATLTAKSGVAANTYYFIVMATDSKGNTAEANVTVTVNAYTQTILNWAATGDFSVYADDSQTALTEISTRVGFGVVIPDNATNVTIKNKSAWTAGNVVTFNGKDYVVDNATCITMTVADLKADADMTIADGDFTETTSYAVTMPATGLTATWSFGTLSDVAVTSSNNKVPTGATVTLTGLDGTYYVKKGAGATDYMKADGDFTMPASALILSDKYVLINTTVALDEDGVTAWPQTSAPADVKVTASVAANAYVKVDDTATFTVTLGLSDTISTGASAAITGQFSSNEATLTGATHVSSAGNVIDASGTSLSSGVTGGVTLKVSANTAADVTVILTLAGGS